jgi:hypothetical protein
MKRIYDFLFEGKAAMWTALFTCALAVFSFLLWKVSRDASDATMATQRAFISASDSNLVTKIGNEKGEAVVGYGFNLTWVNSGETPTKVGSYQVAIRVQDNPPRKKIPILIPCRRERGSRKYSDQKKPLKSPHKLFLCPIWSRSRKKQSTDFCGVGLNIEISSKTARSIFRSSAFNLSIPNGLCQITPRSLER